MNRLHTDLAPLHVSIHAGGFMGGIPEYNAAFASLLSSLTGAVIVLPSYRFAPLHPFPAAIDDIDDVLAWLRSNASQRLGADPSLLTISGFSAGANLALAATQQQQEQKSDPTNIKAAVTFYAPIDLRLPPHEKPIPAGLPRANPISAILPLSDAYVASTGSDGRNVADARLHPFLAELRTLPGRMLFVIPTLDILLHEQLVFVERLKKEAEEEGRERVVESLIVEGQWHGWVECG
ncbi:lipase esterase family [Diplodia corticola]|uniref:Lipase esterase family n=1 Tax=Diplodia corticola TaxID=236234 RepID=A0A1J9R661_9PEZI|nr:lipase esterase family [Diplodia corticola]OJD37006.1 lipase esterase family [Diplodia corticola]